MNRTESRGIASGARTMDLVRERRRTVPRWVVPLAVLAVLAGLTLWALGALSNRTVTVAVDRASLVTDTARRGTLVLSVGAQGAFAPEYVRVVSAPQPGVVNRIFVKPGTAIAPGGVIVQLENPALTAAAAEAAAALRAARASLASAREQARGTIITQQTEEDDARAGETHDALQAASMEKLHRQGLVSDIVFRTAQIQAQKSANDLRSTHAQVGVAAANAQATIAAAQAKVDQSAAQLAADDAQVAALTVRSASAGTVQSLDVDPGATVAQGTQIARVADSRNVKAVLHVAESDVKSVAVGMPARIDDGNAVAGGRVAHIAPAADNGTVDVDVTFTGPPPPGARPAANVDGVIEVAAMHNAVSIARPAGASNGGSIDMFKLVDNGARAVRIRVRLGRGSNDRIQVLSGLRPGDTVVVSDMTPYLDRTELRVR